MTKVETGFTMESTIERDCSALGGLFMQIVNDMKSAPPVWEDFICKTTKYHNALRTTSIASTAFLESFQKVADLATNTKGATRDMGSALTRLCLRHKSIENRRKTFTRLLIEQLVTPLQEKIEDWKKVMINLDKDHAKDYKKARAEIKKAASDTIRLQKKFKKGKSDVQSRLEASVADVNSRYAALEETERNAVRNAMIEQRSQFCHFVACIKPVMDEEISMLTEITHLQEILENLCLMSSEPQSLPAASEQVILDLKGAGDGNTLTYQTPPSSPSSLGSRKSSMCSISSINSTSSDSTNKSSPGHHFRHRTISQLPVGVVRLASVSSQDSGFTSQDTLYHLNPTAFKGSLPESSGSSSSSASSTAGGGVPTQGAFPSSSISTWANWPDPPAFPRQEGGVERPHTISAAFDKTHHRPPLSREIFESPDVGNTSHYAIPQIRNQTVCVTDGLPPIPGPKPRGKAVAVPIVPGLTKQAILTSIPTYVNQDDLAKLAGERQPEDIPEEEETESGGDEDEETDDDAITPTPKNPNRSMATHPAVQKMSSHESELDAALLELQATAAELELSTSRHSVQCSSGYGTMSSTTSEETVVDELDQTLTNLEAEMAIDYSWGGDARSATLPRSHSVGRSVSMRTNLPPAVAPRPITYVQGSGTVRRSYTSAGAKPPPPVRRNSALSSVTASETTRVTASEVTQVIAPITLNTSLSEPKQNLPKRGQRPGQRLGEKHSERPCQRLGEKHSEKPGHRLGEKHGEKLSENGSQVKTHRRSHSDSNSLEALDVTVMTAEEGAAGKSNTLPSPRTRTHLEELPPPPPPEELASDIEVAVNKISISHTNSVNSDLSYKNHQDDSAKAETPIYAEPMPITSGSHEISQNVAQAVNSIEASGHSEGSDNKSPSRSLRRQGSVVESHAELIQTLNIQFAARPAPGPIALSPPATRLKQTQPSPTSAPSHKSPPQGSGATSPHKSPPPVAAKPTKLTRSLSGGDPRKSTAEKENEVSAPSSSAIVQGDGSLLGQITRGVRLRRTICNDRSAPRFPSNQ